MLVTLAKFYAVVGKFESAREVVASLVKLDSSPEVLQLKVSIEKAALQSGTPVPWEPGCAHLTPTMTDRLTFILVVAERLLQDGADCGNDL